MDTNIEISGEMDTEQKTDSKQSNQFSFNSMQNYLQKTFVPNELFTQIRINLRAWTEFFNTQNFKPSSNISRLSKRFLRNLQYFQSNYLCVFVVLMIYCLITSPLILVVLAGVYFACYKIKQAQTPLTIFGKRLSTYQQCLLVNFAATPILYLIGAGAVMFWVLGASFFLISLHAVFYNIDAIVTEDTEGFLSETV